MKLVIAEKPSVGRAIAAVLGATKDVDRCYMEGNGYQVTWAFGHLVDLPEPEFYTPEWRKWNIEHLPMIPKKFALKATNEVGGKKQLAVIERLLAEADEIICATDAAREGELIYRRIVELSGATCQSRKRLWISSLTDEAIKNGFATLKPSCDFDNLFHAAQCRAFSDWLVGMNCSRAFSRHFNANLKIGRVQTPVLALVVQRDKAIAEFKSQPFFDVVSQYKGVDFKHENGRFDDKSAAESVVKRITGAELVVTGVVGKSEKIHAPLLYDLTDLQKDLNVRFGFTAGKTLELVQKLYESKHVTYPRTDSRYLSSDMEKETPMLLEKLASLFKEAAAFQKIDSRFFNDAKVSDHHAIIPTINLPTSLTDDEKKAYDAIAMRFIAASYPPCIKQVTTISALVNSEKFVARGTMIESEGWQSLYPKSGDDKDENALPLLVKDESGEQSPKIVQGKTTAPKAYTEATILSAMETAGKNVEDENLREALRERGLGTPATRAATLEKLKSDGYIEVKGKTLVSTTTGQKLIGLISTDKLKSSELTGEWEFKLKRIEKGDYSPDAFMAEIEASLHEIINDVKASTSTFADSLGTCPVCQKTVVKTNKGYGCSGWREGCTFTIWGEMLGKKITDAVVKQLLETGKTEKIDGFVSKGGKAFSAVLKISDGKVSFDF